MPILIACLLQCDAPNCIYHRPQEGYIDPQGGIHYDRRKGLSWRRSGDKLACCEECEKQLSSIEPTGGGSPGKMDSKSDLRNG